MTNAPKSGRRETNESGSRASVHRTLIESTAEHAVFMLDETRAIISWSRPAKGLFGHDFDAVKNRPLTVLLADSDDSSKQQLYDLLEAATDEPQHQGHWLERADGTRFWGRLSVSPLVSDEIDGYAVVCEDQTERKEHERMLERQNDRLKEFTDIIAHDLRNPLNLIEGRLQQFRETGDEEHIEIIDETSDRMARLVDDLLTVARQGMVVQDPIATDLKHVTATAWEAIGAPTTASMQYETVPPISADPDRVCELFENLLRNAVEHGGESVTVRVGPLDGGFYLEDDGPGINEDLREEVFNHGMSTVQDGHGYGLSIVRTIVNAHGWDVRLIEGEEGGARFEITGIEFVG